MMTNAQTAPPASIVIVTKNRRDDLRTAVRSALGQTVQPEVLILDDGSTDGTADMVRAEFPQVTLHRFEQSHGYIARRNEGARLARGPVIFSIDDDAAFSSTRTVEQTLAQFDRPEIGAIAIPFTEPHKSPTVWQRAPSPDGIWITAAYIGTAHAVRRDLFLKLGGYREYLIHQGEESDFCVRLLAAGHVVRLGLADPIQHFESPRRDFSRMDYYGSRNPVLFAWQNVPLPNLIPHLAATTFNCLRWTLAPKRFGTRLRGIAAGHLDGLRLERTPVPAAVYRRWRRLKKAIATPLPSSPA